MKYRNDLKRRVLAGLFAGAALCLAAPAVLAAGSPIPNGTIPDGGHFIGGKDAGTITPNGTQMDIHQYNQNAVIVWDKGFNVGANATVNFNGPQDGYNTLNYDKSNSMSQIYGTINANNNGNIYIVNPAGVEIGNSAQINVGSLYVSNKYLDDTKLSQFNGSNLSALYDANKTSDAVLMSLGNINASSVTFDGGRVVIDTERLKTGDEKMAAGNIKVNTTDAGSVVIGYDAYDKENETYAGANDDTAIVTVNDVTWTKADGYMWVEDVEQLQKIDTNLGGNYALRNSIDATATQEWNNGAGFKPIGIDSTGKVIVENSKYGFHGNFDGLSYNIFNLNINRTDAVNVGLFGVLHEAEINNVTFVGGAITGGNVVGSLAGAVLGNTHVNNVMNSASVTGGADVGGIIGYSGDEINQEENSDKPITVGNADAHFSNMVNTGTVVSSGTSDGNGGMISNAGGLIGYLEEGNLGGTSYNLGAVTGRTENDGFMIVGYNVGGLVGHAVNSVIGNEDMIDEGGNVIAEGTTVYNRLNVTGAYNVGGIVGNMEGTKVYNAENSGNVSTTGYLNGTYVYHTDRVNIDGYNSHDKTASIGVQIANVGGIAGSASNDSTITNVLNTGNVNSSIQDNNDFYDAGNVGGIVGSAIDTNITDATNRENEIRGAHNVGGIAGYFANSNDSKYTVTNGVNDGGDIMATGARATGIGSLVKNGFAQEHIRSGQGGNEHFNIGNMGGIVGYMDGDNVYITASANRGTVHTQKFTGDAVPASAQAANVGGIVGKIDRSKTEKLDKVKGDAKIAAVSNSYNTGDVMGYTGVGGIAGMMYNGEIAGSYNLGNLRTTRQSQVGITGTIDALNMGGIVGDTTEDGSARVLLYDVYNKGQIGDETYNYFGRHVGGIVGRLSGAVEKAYNTGAIYNGYNVVGGIAGWMYTGSINNAFNTGNITVVNKNVGAASQVGGIVGAADVSIDDITLSNVYNLGTLRSFWKNKASNSHNSLGGIIGGVYKTYGDHNSKKDSVYIINAYTTGNLYIDDLKNSGMIGSIYTNENSGAHFVAENTYYIRPDDGLPFTDLYLDHSTENRDNSNKAIAFENKDHIAEYTFDEGITNPLAAGSGADVNEGSAWRIYDGTTPILNAFLPNAENYFSTTDGAMNGIASIQYGTAYDPLLTIIKANGKKENLDFDWQDLKINNDAGLAVYDAGLTLNDFMSTGGSGYFGGVIYSDGALTLNAHLEGVTHDEANTNVTGDVALGSASQLYGSSVAINADGQVTIYGSVTATGNGTTEQNDPEKDNSGSISITGGSVDIYGQLTSAKDGETVRVPGINGMAEGWNPADGHEGVENPVAHPEIPMSDIGDRFGYTTGVSAVNGNISITANDEADGHVNVYYGNKGEGLVTTAGSLTVTASGDIYMDSDLSIGGNLTLNAGQIKDSDGNPVTAVNSEAVLDISNIGKVQAANGTVKDTLTGLHVFLDHFAENATDGGKIALGGDETKLAVDMWDETANEWKGGFNLNKYDDNNGKTLAERINALNLSVNGKDAEGRDHTYIWVSTGEQLAGIQEYYQAHKKEGTNILSYNFALKNDIDASGVTDYEAIGKGAENGYTGIFDGRDNRIIGLDTTKTSNGSSQTITNAGIFDTIGISKNADDTEQVGTVEDLRVYSGTFHGTNNAGAVAGVNKGNISNVTAFGNVVDVQNTANEVSYAGGIVGANEGSITSASAVGTATQSSIVTAGSQEAAAGGIAGLNTNNGTISTSTSNSAVNASEGNATALGGVAGVNEAKLDNVDSLGVTTGIYKGENTKYSDNVGGIAGKNSGTVTNAYNESIVSGRENVGGVLGTNLAQTGSDKKSPVSNVANAADVTGESAGNDSKHVGGLVGDNEGSITNGRNNGKITGNNYVGGLVGANGAGSTLTNLVNDSAAAITGDKWVGGIAGSNAGKITASSVDEDGQVIEGNDNLINRGTIKGQQYVGGVAGVNTGTIANTNNDVKLYVKDPNATGDEAPRYFGGVAGMNGYVDKTDETKNKTGIIENAKNEATIIAEKADFVGGIVGWNTAAGVLQGMGNSNEGLVEGNSHVGGVAGLNDAAITGKVNSMVGIENSGVVIAHNGGAGGIFGENNGNIEYVEMTNKGIVSGSDSKDKNGTDGTGGIFGVNKGNVIHSSLKNEIGGQVMGTQNVGGLIGQNSGDITGGRDENDGYYKYQIYNNGTIQAGTWNDDDKDGIVDEGEFTAAAGDSENIAGLFGTNSGKVTAGYNTGSVIAKNSTHVGGIAGTNEGTLDQVFNTVMDADGTAGNITGSTNVGGIAGTNSGTISNAYNTSDVYGDADSIGSIAGTNSNAIDDSISNVYSTITRSLVGGTNTTVTNGYNTTTEGDWTKHDSYGGFDFTGSEDNAAVWKIYEGSTNPLLKVFLTQLTVNEYGNEKAEGKTLDEYLNLVYNGREQNIDIADLIDKGFITGPQDMKDAGGNSFVFNAYENTLKDGTNKYHDSDVLYNTTGQVHANEGKDAYSWLASRQIAGGNEDGVFTPNNLGYDIQMNSSPTLHKAQISITLTDVNRTYGSKDFTKGTNYGYSYTIANGNKELNDVMMAELNGAAGITFKKTEDKAVDGFTGDKQTNNANKENENYTWTAEFGFAADSALTGDYTFVTGENQTGNTVTASGKSHVDRANIEIIANPEQVYVDGTPHFSGTDISSILVNGDTISDGSYQYGTEQLPADTSKPGGFDIGIHFDSTYLDGDSDASAWDGVLNSLFKNYNVTFKPGTLTVVEWPADVVEPPVDEHWNFLFHDNPWDRNRDFRERKAEVHFVAGGMTL